MYDARGSVIQTVTGRATEYIAEAMKTPNVSLLNFTIQSYACAPFGEQMGAKISGYTHNAEAFDAATGMHNLRARQYEACLQRFSQLDDFFRISNTESR